jgi:hypothetical protein
VLIHPSGALPDTIEKGLEIAQQCELAFELLPLKQHDRVWWLFYSGGGYHHLSVKNPQLHFLHYLVGQTMTAEEVACFRAFVDELKSDEIVNRKDLWDKLYPKGNMMAATLLAILSAEKHAVDIRPAIQNLLAQQADLRQAHQECESREHRSRYASSLSYEEWHKMLSRADYGVVRDQLVGALGAVPD